MALQTNGQKVTKVIRGNGLNELALFAGAGGGILGGKLLGWRTVCAVEWEQYPACVLAARQNDGILPPFPIWDDVQTFDGNPWRGIVDVVSGGFPCQDISAAGKGAGIDGERSGMWKEMARVICEVRPQYAFIENSPMLTIRGLESVLADLAKMGFDAEWGVLSAADVGANHLRERIWIVAKDTQQHRFFSHTEHNRDRWGQQQSESIEEKNGTMANPTVCGWKKCDCQTSNKKCPSNVGGSNSFTRFTPNWWSSEPSMGRVADGVVARVDRLKAIGNGQVPLCAATAWNILKGRLDERV
jgi:DNA (cytosine-5)-methyltransferase 1